MIKAEFNMEMPERCSECDFSDREMDGIDNDYFYCPLANVWWDPYDISSMSEFENARHKACPLKEL